MINRQVCDCGERLPLHIMNVGNLTGVNTTHVCSCGKEWKLEGEEVKLVAEGVHNPFAQETPLDRLNGDLQKVGGPVVHPEHYNACGEKDGDGSVEFEPIKVIEAWGWGEGFCYGNAIKYILRAPHKGSERADLEKAHWYLCRLFDAQPASGPREAPESCGAMRVAQAWKLPGRLQRAIEHIAVGSYGAAAGEITKYLVETRMAETIAEEVDAEILAELEDYSVDHETGQIMRPCSCGEEKE